MGKWYEGRGQGFLWYSPVSSRTSPAQSGGWPVYTGSSSCEGLSPFYTTATDLFVLWHCCMGESDVIRSPAKKFYSFCVLTVITFCVSCRWCKMYISHVRLSVCLSLSAAACPQYCMDPDVTRGNGRVCPDLCTIGRICNRCPGWQHNANVKCRRALVLAVCLVFS